MIFGKIIFVLNDGNTVCDLIIPITFTTSESENHPSHSLFEPLKQQI